MVGNPKETMRLIQRRLSMLNIYIYIFFFNVKQTLLNIIPQYLLDNEESNEESYNNLTVRYNN